MNKQRLPALDTFEAVFDAISSFFETDSVLSQELVKAREDFFKLTGKLNQTDVSFTNRMNAFLLWFTFDWQCADTLKTPFEIFKESVEEEVTGDETTTIQDVENHIHSLFETLKLSESKAVVKDLYSRKKYEIMEPDFLLGSRKGIYFETRILKINGHYRFSNYFIQHPLEVKKDVKKRCKTLFKKKEPIKPFLTHLHSYHTKWERYRNINIKSIYHFDKSIPEAK